MKKTDNFMVFIGRHIIFDDIKFCEQLKNLKKLLPKKSNTIKDYVHENVPIINHGKNKNTLLGIFA